MSGGNGTSGMAGCILNDALGSLILVDVEVSGCTLSGFIINFGGGIANFGDLLMQGSAVHDNSSPGSLGSQASGAGVYTNGSARIEDSSVVGNVSGDLGGGLWAGVGSNLVVARSLLGKNQSGRFGGALYNLGVASLSDVALDNNSAGGQGGAIWNIGDGTLEVNGSTFSHNRAGLWGSAIENNGILTLRNSTVSANPGPGAAVNTSGAMSRADISFVTFSDNAGGAMGKGTGQATVRASVLMELAPAPNCTGTFASGGGNVDSGNSCGFSTASDRSGVSPGLLPLAANGGFTRTHALDPASPAIDLVAPPCPSTDQRGVARPQGAACDSGAYER